MTEQHEQQRHAVRIVRSVAAPQTLGWAHRWLAIGAFCVSILVGLGMVVARPAAMGLSVGVTLALCWGVGVLLTLRDPDWPVTWWAWIRACASLRRTREWRS